MLTLNPNIGEIDVDVRPKEDEMRFLVRFFCFLLEFSEKKRLDAHQEIIIQTF